MRRHLKVFHFSINNVQALAIRTAKNQIPSRKLFFFLINLWNHLDAQQKNSHEINLRSPPFSLALCALFPFQGFLRPEELFRVILFIDHSRDASRSLPSLSEFFFVSLFHIFPFNVFQILPVAKPSNVVRTTAPAWMNNECKCGSKSETREIEAPGSDQRRRRSGCCRCSSAILRSLARYLSQVRVVIIICR